MVSLAAVKTPEPTIMLAHQETLDFVDLTHDEIRALLQKYNLVLTADEALTIQQTILKRPPSLAELVLWSIQGSEHCSYKCKPQTFEDA